MRTGNKKPPMSFWGIGPLFALFNIVVMGIALALTVIYPQIFRFAAPEIAFYMLGAVFDGFGLYLWISGGRQIDACIMKGVLATEGVYSIVRNPIYSGSLFVIAGIAIATRSWLLLVLLPVSYSVLKILLRSEDSVLTHAFGAAYLQYKARVNAVIPNFNRLSQAFFYPVETQKINDSLYVVKNRDVNIFIYKTANHYICFDSGYGDAEVLRELARLGIDQKAIAAVFLTHSDYDHASGIYDFAQATLYFGKAEAPLINGKRGRFGIFYSNPKITREYSLLEDQQTVTIDNTTIKAIYTPGHTCGHVIYQIDDEIIISGDAVIWQNQFIKPFYRLYNMNHKKAFASAERIMELEGKYLICTAHSGIVPKAKCKLDK